MLALERGQIGERYILGGENLLLKDLLALIAAVVGRRPPRIELPEAVVWPVALFMEGLARLTGIPPMMTRDHLQNGTQEDVLLVGQGDRRAGLCAASRARGDRGCGGVVPRQRHGRRHDHADGAVAADLAVSAARARAVLAIGPGAAPARPATAPSVAVVVPARDEAAVIEASLRSLLAQDYAGPLRVILVDDGSSDGTGDIARDIADPRLTVVNGRPGPPAGAASCGRSPRD